MVIVVLDSCGIGALPDADRYGDEGSSTLPHTAEAIGGIRLPTLEGLGLGRIVPVRGVAPLAHPVGAFGRMAERSPGKDTTTGHWEMMGIILDRPFPTYPDGFPAEVIEAFERRIGTRTLGNTVASGTEIIEELGPEHERTGYPIVYTSADSVFQIAAHEDVVPVEQLYRICAAAREVLTGPHAVSRVIARPFRGRAGRYERTDRRRDFSLAPPRRTVLDAIVAAGYEVTGVGKIPDIFAGRGITRGVHTHDDLDGVARTAEAMDGLATGMVLANLVDLDSKYGHRNDPVGYGRDLEAIDAALAEVLRRVGDSDLLLVTADHGNDPTTPSTDHSREYTPILVAGPRVRAGADLGTRETFADVGATVAAALGVPWDGPGTSFLSAATRGGGTG